MINAEPDSLQDAQSRGQSRQEAILCRQYLRRRQEIVHGLGGHKI